MTSSALDEPRTRGYKKKERTRRNLVTAAIDVIAERGEAFSISDIASRAGVANGTFYNYFEDREAVVDAIVPEVLSGFAASSAAAVDQADPVVRFATITALALRRAAAAPDQMRVVLRLDTVQRALVDGAALDHLRADLAAGSATGHFTAEIDEATVDVVIGSLLRAVRRIVEQPVAADYPARVVTQLLRSLGVADTEAAHHAAEAVAAASALVPDA